MDEVSKIMEYPLSLLLAVCFLLIVWVVHRYAGQHHVVRTLSGSRCGHVLLGVGAVMLAIEGTWSVPIHRSWYFALYLLVLLVSLGLATLAGYERRARAAFLLSHTGIFLILWAAFFGSPDVIRGKMIVPAAPPQNVAFSADGMIIPLPFRVSLEDFSIDYYADGHSPRQFTSTLQVDKDTIKTSVNHPAQVGWYTLFQDNYDAAYGRYTVLQVVRDPWLPLVYAGMVFLSVGSVLLLFGRWRARVVVPVTLVLTVAFTFFTVNKISFGTLMPALRSWWFVPHLFIYMVAYSLMALSVIFWVVERFWRPHLLLSDPLLRSSSALLVIGMLTGSVWARQAWGDYWSWDAKENWAAVTWFIALMALHARRPHGRPSLAILLLAFLALQITWYGVNYLPSAKESLHTYTK